MCSYIDKEHANENLNLKANVGSDYDQCVVADRNKCPSYGTTGPTRSTA